MTTKTGVSDSSPNQQRMIMVIAAIVVIAVVGAVVFIASSGRPATTVNPDRYASIPQSRTEDGGFVLGDPDAPITIVEFADFLCPHCQSYEEESISPFIDQYVETGRAKLEYRAFPVIDRTFSFLAAQMAECADSMRSGSFWVAHDTLFELASSTRFNNDTMRTFAQRMNLNYSDLLSCTQTADQVNVDYQLGQDVGVQGTPATLVRYRDGVLQWPGGSPGRGGIELAGLEILVNNAAGQ